MWDKLFALWWEWLFGPKQPEAMPDPDDLTLGVDAAPLATAVVNGATEGLKVFAQLEALANSPDMIKAAAARKKLQEIDALVTAQKQNDLEAERKAFENA